MPTALPAQLQAYHDHLETIEPDEPETARALSETMLSIAYKTYGDSGHAIRSVHAKSHGVLKADLEILDGLPQPLAQGLFSKPGHHPAIIRLSSTPGDILHDSVSTPRGMAIKVLDVEGERLDGADSTSQDFVLVNGRQFNAASAKDFLKSLKLLAATTDRAEGLKTLASKAFRGIETVLERFGGESATLKSMGGHPETHILGESFFGQLPIRYGDYVAKIGVFPVSPELTALTDTPLDINHDGDGLRHAVSAYFTQHQAVWELRVQLCSSVEDMPVEDATAVWNEDKSPFITVARLTAAPQQSWSEDRATMADDGMGFRPWNALAAHRPLSSIMRMRRLAYKQGQAFRSQRNAIAVTEPSSLDTLPDR
jgi:hypothetical protein